MKNWVVQLDRFLCNNWTQAAFSLSIDLPMVVVQYRQKIGIRLNSSFQFCVGCKRPAVLVSRSVLNSALSLVQGFLFDSECPNSGRFHCGFYVLSTICDKPRRFYPQRVTLSQTNKNCTWKEGGFRWFSLWKNQHLFFRCNSLVSGRFFFSTFQWSGDPVIQVVQGDIFVQLFLRGCLFFGAWGRGLGKFIGPHVKAWRLLGDRLIPEQLLWVGRGILHVGPTKSFTFSRGTKGCHVFSIIFRWLVKDEWFMIDF